jgi:hypothetical protein
MVLYILSDEFLERKQEDKHFPLPMLLQGIRAFPRLCVTFRNIFLRSGVVKVE